MELTFAAQRPLRLRWIRMIRFLQEDN
jgi:hypothetical protein